MNSDLAVATAVEIADQYARPDAADLPTGQPWWHQSLAHGAPGIILLHTELAAAGLRPFDRAHDWLTVTAGSPVTAGVSTGLFYGAPALARALALLSSAPAGTGPPPRPWSLRSPPMPMPASTPRTSAWTAVRRR